MQTKTRLLLFAFFFAANGCLFAQSTWKVLSNSPGPNNAEGRIDDVCFINRDTGWCVTSRGNIFYTPDGGLSWTKQLAAGNQHYFRSVEFRNAQLGFAGTLSSRLYRTTDGGATWTNIASQINPAPEAICGISIPSDEVVYAVGQWDEPAFVLKSSDAGLNWQSINMSNLAKGLVDVLFTHPDTGWVAGKGIGGGTILHTTDGGATWTELFNTGNNGEYIWKLQRVTPMVWVASVQTMTSPSGRMVKSTDGGLTWTALPAPLTDMQGIGFATPELGWVGGYNNGFYQTTDGGASWTYQAFGGNFNRFYFLDSTFAYASGNRIYQFSPNSSSTQYGPDNAAGTAFEFTLSPNPTNGKTQVHFKLDRTDNIRISLLNAQGIELQRLYRGRLPQGEHTVDLEVSGQPAGTYLVWLQRNHGLFTKPLVIK